jgi:hypothetical protein
VLTDALGLQLSAEKYRFCEEFESSPSCFLNNTLFRKPLLAFSSSEPRGHTRNRFRPSRIATEG